MKYGLTERSLNTLNSIFSQYNSIQKVVLYGSRAKGNYKNGSDIDITLITDNSFTHSDLLHIMNNFDESSLPYFVDVSIYNSIQNYELIAHIKRVGKTIWEKHP